MKTLVEVFHGILEIGAGGGEVERRTLGCQVLLFFENIHIHIEPKLVIFYFNRVVSALVFHNSS